MKKNYYLFLIIFCLSSCIDNTQANKEELKAQIRNELLDSIKKTDSSKIVLYTYKIKKGKKILIYNNNTWEYNSTENKQNSLQLGIAQTIKTTAKPNPKKQPKKYDNYSGSSGSCGHPTKSGGSCRRKVKGGGYCWQHS